MPEPIKRGQRYMPGLDGLRAIAVLAVIVYHLKFGWVGGLLGVGVFFTLSGYLITDILLAQAAEGRIALKAFWLARARRLFPGLFVMLIVVMAWVTVIGPHQPPDFRTAATTAAFYVNNWWLIFHDVSYFQAFGAPSPLDHLWSLSVEEQFYIVWPLLMILGVRFVPERRKSSTGVRVRLARVTLVLVVVSAILMAVLYKPGIDPSRVYYGTDTRALEILAGAALAMVWPSRRLRPNIAESARRIIDGAGIVGLIVIAVMFWQADEYAPFLYRGGFVLLSLATAVVVAALVHPAARLGKVIGAQPLRWIGERSYGIYLWHFPIIILTTPKGAQEADLGRALLQVSATFAVAALSWRFVEDPIRHGALGRMWADIKAGRRRERPVSRRGWALAAALAGVFVAALAGLAGAGVGPDRSKEPGSITLSKTVTAKRVPVRANRTSCNSVIHIGDSTSEGLESAQYLPNPKQRISVQYARVGATTQHLEISGARSIYERYQGTPNGEDVAQAWRADHFSGCWVLALGTNEAANVAAGSAITLDKRIDTMMSTIGNQPVMWVNVKSLVTTGPYAATNMRSWNAALLKACVRYPNMRIYDWAAQVRNSWFIPDGIHFTTPGYAMRSRLIARALLTAFPATRGPAGATRTSCLVRPPPEPEPAPPRPTPTPTPTTPSQTP
jgi:peptidoglycan/LPS O-acetylase OafA/YrhL